MSEIKKLGLKSMDIIREQKEKFRQLFPEVFTENNIDFEKLKLALGKAIEGGKERYGMTWPGKADCFKIIQDPSIGTLKPCREESVNFDTTENLFIEGDNLEVLKLLQKSYYGKVKMIYIDPPYNTGNDFIYPDDYKENLTTYLQYTGQVDAEGKKFSTNMDTEGRFHTKWMNMIYPRLFLAKNLLSDNGVIFISIDDNEVSNLRKICEGIFGEENFIGCFVRRRRQSQANLSQNLSTIHEYVLCYAKNLTITLNKVLKNIKKDHYKNPDNDYRGQYVTMPCSNKGGAEYEITTPTGKKYIDEWRFKEETYNSLLQGNRIVFPKSGNGKPRYKLFLNEKMESGVIPNTWLDNLASNQEATRELKALFDGKVVLENPKPVGLIKFLLQLGTNKEDIILDFFAGSASTAHAVIDFNLEDKSHRKFIMVQLPELCEESSEACKEGFKTIADIGEERIRRVIRNIQKEKGENLFKDKELDLGFKVFKLDKSNFKIWDTERSLLDKKSLEKQLELHINHIDYKSSQDDILYEILLKAGFELTTKIEKIELAGKVVYSIEGGAMLICLEKELTKELIKAMAKKQPNRVICLDSGFANNDQLKTNAVQIMKSKSVEDFRTV